MRQGSDVCNEVQCSSCCRRSVRSTAQCSTALYLCAAWQSALSCAGHTLHATDDARLRVDLPRGMISLGNWDVNAHLGGSDNWHGALVRHSAQGVLYCIVLFVLYSTVLCCTVLSQRKAASAEPCSALCCMVVYCTVLLRVAQYTVLYCAMLYSTVPALRCIVQRCKTSGKSARTRIAVRYSTVM